MSRLIPPEPAPSSPTPSGQIGRLRAINGVLAIALLFVLGLASWQSMKMAALESTLAQTERDLRFSVGKLAVENMKTRREELVRAATWLNGFYQSQEGLQRPTGLWLADQQQPDIEAIAVWIFDVYLRARIDGKSEEEARMAIADTIRGTDEWRRKHPNSK
jgi:hypothetical protein